MAQNLNASSSGQNLALKTDWEGLRKQARQAENEIESKLVSFSKLCSTYTLPKEMMADSPPILNSDTMFETLSLEIEQLLKKLNLINSKMSDSLGVTDITDTTNANMHMLQRHREILRDYSQEYDKTKRNIVSYREREKLLSPSSLSSSSKSNGLNNRRNDPNQSATSLYMKENDHLKNSHLLVDQQLELAESTKENLYSQKQRLKMIHEKMTTFSNKFPLISSLLQRTKFKKRKDSIILATVIAVCIILFLLYVF